MSTQRARGFSLIEVALATVVVGGLMVAIIRGVAVAGKATSGSADHAQGELLASQLMNEVTGMAFADPSGGTSLGLDPGEAVGVRTNWDDVDDYHRLNEVPSEPNGTPLPGLSNWKWKVTVSYADATGPIAAVSVSKQITVEVSRGGKPLAKLVRVRTAGRDAAEITSYIPNQAAPTYSSAKGVGAP